MSVEGQDHSGTPGRSPGTGPSPGALRARIDDRLKQVAGERRLLWDPLPRAVPGSMNRLVDTVEDLTSGLGVQGRLWLAAALAVLSEDLESRAAQQLDGFVPEPATAVAVVAEQVGVLAGRRRDDLSWVLPLQRWGRASRQVGRYCARVWSRRVWRFGSSERSGAVVVRSPADR